MDTIASMLKMDKTAFSVASLFDESDEKAYWLSKTPYERLQAIELSRRLSRLLPHNRRASQFIERPGFFFPCARQSPSSPRRL